jgi:hypothetical protein
MPLTRLITIIALLAIVGGLIFYDIYLAANKVDGDTISEITAHYAKRSMFLPIALGILIGHFLWPSTWVVSGWVTLGTLIALGGTALGFDLYEIFKGGIYDFTMRTIPFLRQFPIIIFTVGVFIGRLVWPQHIST